MGVIANMFTVVPNMHDAIAGANPNAINPNHRPVTDDRGDRPDFHTQSLCDYRTSGPRSQYVFVPHSRSGQRDFTQSMRVSGEMEPWHPCLPSHLVEANDFESSDDHSSFLTSVVVVPKSAGQGYNVFSSSRRRGGSIVEEFETSDILEPRSCASVFEASAPVTTKAARSPSSISVSPSRALRPRTLTHAEAVASQGTRYSKNIGNPAMKKRVKQKYQDAINRADMLKSTVLVADESKTNATASRPSTPTVVRKAAPENKSSSPSLLKDSTNIAPSAALGALPRETLLAQNSLRLPSPAMKSPSSLSPHNDRTSPPLPRNERHSFHESLMYNSNTVHERNSLHSSMETRGHGAPTGVLSGRTATPVQPDPRPASPSRSGFFSFMKRRRAAKKHDSFDVPETPRQRQDFGANSATAHHSCGTSSRHSPHGHNEFACRCKVYHQHPLSGKVLNADLLARKERREEMILSSMRLELERRIDTVDDPRNVFWTPALSFHPYKHGDKKVSFASLWPTYKELREHLQNSGIQQTVLGADAVMDLCVTACTIGPTHLLQCLVELQLIRVDQVLESGAGLLHLAFLAHNLESAQYLMAARISPKIRDIQGLTADQVCFNPSVRKQMAPRYMINRDVSKDKILLKPSLQDKDTIFKLASNPKHFGEIQKKLQTLDFNVNTECDNNGDFLLHIAVRRGLTQLPLLMALVKIQGADIELCNAEGMTPLMLAAIVGNYVLCDVLICLFGADPNKPNSQSGRSALHYAAEGNHRKTVEYLIRRGADANMEDHEGLRADDVPACIAATDDCREIIMFNRTRRLDVLSELVRQGEIVSSQLLPSDMCVVDADGNTLIMIAAAFNKSETLQCLLECSDATINAQHSKTGMTALAIAAKLGSSESVEILLRHSACPTIADMSGYLPLHHAVMNNHESVVDVILNHFPETFVSLYKAMRLCKRTSIHTKLKVAWEERQEKIVTPKLLSCALNGDAEDLFLLLDEGDNINPKSGTGNWPLYLAVENGHLEVVKLLFEKGGDIRKHHPTTGSTALHLAAKMGHSSIVSFLLQYCRQSLRKNGSSVSNFRATEKSRSYLSQERRKRSLDVNAVDRDNKTALQLAAEKGYSKIVELLLLHGATTAMLDAEGNLVTCPQFEGVRLQIETHRQQHTRQIIDCIQDKSRKALPILQQLWLPKFDHHLRNKEGSTPLMIAAEMGKLPIIEFLLDSAVYKEVTQFDSSSDSDSDTDSGVLDPTTGSPREGDFDGLVSHEEAPMILSMGSDLPTTTKSEPGKPCQSVRSGSLADSSEFYQHRLTRIVYDANRPKGMSIYHDGQISHVCAVNLNDGTNVLHHAIQNSDPPNVLALILEKDPTPLNMQDVRGETVFHAACRLGRKKCIEMLLARSDLDLNIRTLDGLLPEEVATSKNIKKMIEKARMFQAVVVPEQVPLSDQTENSLGGSFKSPSLNGSTVNFDKVHLKYEALKLGDKGDKTS